MGTKGVGRGNGAGSKATRFKPGHPGRKGAKKGETGPPKGSVLPWQLLRDMRWVVEHDEKDDRTPGHQTCRQALKADHVWFMCQYFKAEESFRRLKEAREGEIS